MLSVEVNPTSGWNERDRLEALASYDILDSPREKAFDDIVRLASQGCEAPIAVVTFVDKDRQWFKAHIGMQERETPLFMSICAHAILQKGLFIVSDAAADARFQNNPVVTGSMHVRFYAAAVLETPEGLPLGTVSVMDHKPRKLTDEQAFTLEALACQVMTQLELRRILKEKTLGEQRYRFLADTMPQIVWTAQPDGNLDYYNQRWFAYAGTNLEQMQNLHWTSFVHPEDLPSAAVIWQKSLNTGCDYEVEFRVRRFDGSFRWHLVRAFPMKGETGQVMLWVGTCTDIDDQRQLSEKRRRAEAALFHANQQLESVLASITDGLVILDRNWCYTYFSEQAAEMCEVNVEDVMGKCIWDVFPHTIGTKFYDEHHRSVATGKPVHFEEFYPAPLNKWFEVHGYPSAEGHSIYFRDITDRKKAEQAIRESESKLRLYFDSHIIGNIIADINGTVSEANDEYLRIIGYSREELLAHQVRWDVITPPEFLHIDHQAIILAKQTGFSGPYEKQYVRKDGSRIWVMVGFVIFDQTKTVAFILDISARKQAETELQEAKAKLQAHSRELEMTVESRTSKLQETIAELEHFSYAIVHDLRAPLRAMEGYADMMEEELASGDFKLTREYTRRIKTAARRMDRLISDSLNYSKTVRQELAMEQVNLFNLLDGLIQTYPNLRSEEADIQIDRELPIVIGNEAALTQCFANLLGNAVKFSKTGQRPIIVVRPDQAEGTRAGSSASGNSSLIRIWIEDNGIGIPREAQKRVFGLFQRASKQREGTGVGLAIVRKVVERMNGRVGVESEEGGGSRFWVELPLVDGRL